MSKKRSAHYRAAQARVVELLQTTFPQTFFADPADIRPLAIGIRDELFAWSETQPELPRKRIHHALHRYCGSSAYKNALKAGVMRVNLKGELIEPVTAEAEALAQAYLADLKQRRIEAAQRKAEEQAQREAEQAKLKAEAEARKAAKAAKQQAKAKAKKPAPAPKPVAVAVAPKPAPAVIVKKKRRVIA